MVKKEGGEYAVCHCSNVSLQLSMCRKHTHLHVNNKTHPHVPPFCKHSYHHANNNIAPHIPSSYVPTSPQVFSSPILPMQQQRQ